jgi:hypothetical protein
VIASRHSEVRAKHRGTLVLMAESNRSSRLALFAACAMFARSNRLRRIPDIDAPGHGMTN